jgi:hypothetical protein
MTTALVLLAIQGPLAWLLTFMAVGVFLSGLRDLVSARRPAKRAPSHA